MVCSSWWRMKESKIDVGTDRHYHFIILLLPDLLQVIRRWVEKFKETDWSVANFARGKILIKIWIALDSRPWWVYLPSIVARSWSVLSATNCKKDVSSGHDLVEIIVSRCSARITYLNKIKWCFDYSLALQIKRTFVPNCPAKGIVIRRAMLLLCFLNTVKLDV